MKMKPASVVTSVMVILLALFGAPHAQGASQVRAVTIGAQSPNPASVGSMASYEITVTRAGGGSLDVYLTISGLPAGITNEFVPPRVSFSDLGPSSKTATLVIHLPLGMTPGTYPFSLDAEHGSSQNVVSVPAELVVGGEVIEIQPPLLNIPVLQVDGTISLSGSGAALQPVFVQATTNLASATSWETIAVKAFDAQGFLALVDQDSTNYPARFYRLAH